MNKLVPLLAKLLGAGLFANGFYMLADPVNWYFLVPGVTSTGPFNQHFVRDIGMTFLFVGAGYVLGGIYPAHRIMLWSAATLWLAGHALFHLWEVASGICGPAKLAIDFPGVFAPALIGTGFCIWAAIDARSAPVNS
jgi:hypothetical protein